MNSIINQNLGGDNNPISSLSFHWSAIFKDGSKISQFEEGIEHRFQEVRDRFSELAYFNLTNHKGKLFMVDLINGLIGYNYLALPYVESKEKKKNVRLIFFRRHKVELSTDLKEKNHNIIYHLGFQYNDSEGKNRKIILRIDKEGNWILGE